LEYESNGSFHQFDNEIAVTSYKTIDDSHLSKNGFITEILINIQKIIKHKIKDDNLSIDKAAEVLKDWLLKTNIRDSFRFIDLWSIHCDAKNENFEIEFFTLKKVQSK
jgi:hypothetical protein